MGYLPGTVKVIVLVRALERGSANGEEDDKRSREENEDPMER